MWNCGDFIYFIYLLARMVYTKLYAIGDLRNAETLREALREALRETGRDLERAFVAGWRAKCGRVGQKWSHIRTDGCHT